MNMNGGFYPINRVYQEFVYVLEPDLPPMFKNPFMPQMRPLPIKNVHYYIETLPDNSFHIYPILERITKEMWRGLVDRMEYHQLIIDQLKINQETIEQRSAEDVKVENEKPVQNPQKFCKRLNAERLKNRSGYNTGDKNNGGYQVYTIIHFHIELLIIIEIFQGLSI